MKPLQQAAQAVIDRWDSPRWKDADATAVFIDALRKVLEAEQAQAVDTLLEARAQEPELLDPSVHHKLTQLSDDQIDSILAATPRKFGTGRPDYRNFARAIEKHHGIGAKP